MQLSTQQEIRILHVDDDPSITDLTGTFLEREDDRFVVETATSADEGLQRISDRLPDCVVSDYDMPGMDGLKFLQTVREESPDLPFILFTGKGSETVASDAIAADITDYLQKGSGTEQYELLANRIRNAVQANRDAQRVDRQEQLMRLTEFTGDTGGFEVDIESGDLLLTDGTRRLVGVPEDAHLCLEEAIELYHPDDQADVRQTLDRAAETGDQTRGTYRLQTLDGDERLVEVTLMPATEGTEVAILRGAVHDITERRERRQELEQIETVFQNAQDGLFLMNTNEGFPTERVNPAYEEIRGVSAEQVRGQTLREVLGDQAGAVAERQCRECVERRESLTLERTLRRKGEKTHYVTRISPVVVDGSVEYIAGSLRDVTVQRERQQEFKYLQQAIDEANVSIMLADPSQEDNPLVYVNDAFEDVTGYLPEEALGRNCRFLQGEDTDPEKVTALRDAITDEEQISLELCNYRKDGTKFWNRLTLTPIHDDSNDLIRYLGTQEDITEQKERERELRAERRFINEALNALDDLFYVVNTDGTLRRWNDRLSEVTGYTDNELTDMDAIELFPEDDREMIAEVIETTLADGRATLEADVQTADGECLPYEFTGAQLTDADGNTTGLVGIGRNLTREKTREYRALAEEYEALLETSGDAIFMLDVETTGEDQDPAFEFARLSPGYETQTGISTEEVRGKTPQAVFGSDRGAELEANYTRCVEQRGPISYREELTIAEDARIWETRLAPVIIDGDIIRIVGIARNMTEQVEREREMHRQNERLEEFASVISHDLRSPLSVAKGRLELIRDECASDHIDEIEQALTRMDALIEDVLTLAREGNQLTETESVRLASVVKNSWQMVHTEQATLEIEPSASQNVEADRNRLQQLFENLHRNAIEHGGTDVTVSVGAIDNGFYLADTGPGISPSDREDVFEAGYSTSKDGTGFGLRIVEQIADAHGWEITVTESENGEGGARFEFTGVEVGQ